MRPPVGQSTAAGDQAAPAATSLPHYKRRKIPQTTPPKPSPPPGRAAASGPASQAGRARAARRAVQHWKQLLHYPAGLQRGPAALRTPEEERAAISSWETVASIQSCTGPSVPPGHAPAWDPGGLQSKPSPCTGLQGQPVLHRGRLPAPAPLLSAARGRGDASPDAAVTHSGYEPSSAQDPSSCEPSGAAKAKFNLLRTRPRGHTNPRVARFPAQSIRGRSARSEVSQGPARAAPPAALRGWDGAGIQLPRVSTPCPTGRMRPSPQPGWLRGPPRCPPPTRSPVASPASRQAAGLRNAAGFLGLTPARPSRPQKRHHPPVPSAAPPALPALCARLTAAAAPLAAATLRARCHSCARGCPAPGCHRSSHRAGGRPVGVPSAPLRGTHQLLQVVQVPLGDDLLAVAVLLRLMDAADEEEGREQGAAEQGHLSRAERCLVRGRTPETPLPR